MFSNLEFTAMFRDFAINLSHEFEFRKYSNFIIFYRVERVEANLPADNAGLKSGDNVIFVNKTNVVTLSEEKILDIIK